MHPGYEMTNIAEGVTMLELTANMMGRTMSIHPTLIQDGDNVILTDTGMPGQYDQIERELRKAGTTPEKINRIILTHQDIDHIGGTPMLLQKASRPITVYAHETDTPYIEGQKPLIKLDKDRFAKILESAPEAARKQIEAMIANPPKAKVDERLKDGMQLPFAGGITVIFTPGHTPGHISLYLHRSKTLIAADAMIIADGQLQGPNPQNTPDMESALNSLQKFRQYDIETVICYHGGIYRDNANRRLAELAES